MIVMIIYHDDHDDLDVQDDCDVEADDDILQQNVQELSSSESFPRFSRCRPL